LGVQDVHATHQQIEAMLRAAGGSPVEIPVAQRRYTDSQIVGTERQCAHIADVFGMLGYSEVSTLDFSDAESPDIIHDLNEPIPDELRERFDLVFDIGVVEHVCDIFQALKNCMAMVKPGGAVMHFVPLHGWHNMVYFNFQPVYFLEVYGANGFQPMRAFINFYPQYDEWKDQRMLYREYRYGDEMIFQMDRKFTNLCFLARKATNTEPFVKPIQGFYLRYHGEPHPAEAAAGEPDGRRVALVKRRIPKRLLQPLLKLNRLRLRIEDLLLPHPLRERMWCWRRRRHLLALDRERDRQVFWV